MTIADYLINAVFVLVVLRQARERQLDLRSFLVPLLIVFLVARNYIHSIPSSGNDLVLVGTLVSVGLVLGGLGGLATHVRLADDGTPLARVGSIAGALLIAGICARMIFVFVVNNGGEAAIRSFSIAHHISAAAWPVALVAMALFEVATRLVMVQYQGHRMTAAAPPTAAALGAGS